MSENFNEEVSKNIANDSVSELANALKKLTVNSEELNCDSQGDSSSTIREHNEMNIGSDVNDSGTSFKVAKTNLPEKTSAWTKIKNALFYEIKVELTPNEQKIEDDINEFLHQEITWSSFKTFLFKEVPITYKGKRVF